MRLLSNLFANEHVCKLWLALAVEATSESTNFSSRVLIYSNLSDSGGLACLERLEFSSNVKVTTLWSGHVLNVWVDKGDPHIGLRATY